MSLKAETTNRRQAPSTERKIDKPKAASLQLVSCSSDLHMLANRDSDAIYNYRASHMMTELVSVNGGEWV